MINGKSFTTWSSYFTVTMTLPARSTVRFSYVLRTYENRFPRLYGQMAVIGVDSQPAATHQPCAPAYQPCLWVWNWNWMGYVVRSQYWLLYTTGGVCACYWVFEPQIRRLKSVMVSTWTCDSLSWFQSTIVICFYKKNELINCSVWAVGTMKHLLLLVVNCWTKFGVTWSGKCLGWMCLLFVFWGRKNVSVG